MVTDVANMTRTYETKAGKSRLTKRAIRAALAAKPVVSATPRHTIVPSQYPYEVAMTSNELVSIRTVRQVRETSNLAASAYV